MIERVFRFFPPPVFLTMPHSGLSLSDDGIRLVTFSEKNGHRKLVRTIHENIPNGVVVSGSIEKPEVLIPILSKIQKRYGIEFVAVTIPDEKTYTFKVSLEYKKDISITDMVALKIKENVPMEFSEAIFDYNIVSSTEKNIEVIIRVVHRKVTSAYTALFRSASLKPLLFKVESQAIADAVLGPHDTGSRIIVHIESHKTVCTLVNQGFSELSTVLDIGTNSFVEALSKSLGISSDEALLLCTGKGKKINQEDFFFSIANLISVIRDQVIRYAEYWKVKDEKGRSVEQLIVSGMPASIDGLAHYFEQSTGIRTGVANVWENAFSLDHTVPEIPFAEALDYAPAIGLALPRQLHF